MIEEFATQNRLKTKLDECGERIIVGKQGQLYEYNDTELGVMFMMPPTVANPWGRWCPKMWGNLKRAGIVAGMAVRQNGDSEGCLTFDPQNPEQVRLALKIAKVRPKRQVSEEQRAAMALRLANVRLNRLEPQQEVVLGVQERGSQHVPASGHLMLNGTKTGSYRTSSQSNEMYHPEL